MGTSSLRLWGLNQAVWLTLGSTAKAFPRWAFSSEAKSSGVMMCITSRDSWRPSIPHASRKSSTRFAKRSFSVLQSIPEALLATGTRTYMLSHPSGAMEGSVRVGTWRYMEKSGGRIFLSKMSTSRSR